MEEHLEKLAAKLFNCKNEKKEILSGIWWSSHESNPLLISFIEINKLSRTQSKEIQNAENNFMSIQQFTDFIYKRKLAEDKAVQKATEKHEALKKKLDDFEQVIMEYIEKLKKTLLEDVLPDQSYMHLCNKFLKAYVDGNFKSDEELINNTKLLIKDIIATGAIEENKFAEKINKDTDTTKKENQIERILENIKKCFDEGLNFKFKPQAKINEIGVQYEKPPERFSSSIILKEDEHDMVSGWVKDQVGALKKFELLFNSKDHGFGQQTFHSKCDGKGPTIVFVETTTGKRFGGYANSSWHSRCREHLTDEKCFIFSLDFKEKYIHKPGNKYSMYGHNSYGPIFGEDHDFWIADNCNINGSNNQCIPNKTYNWGSRTANDFAGSEKFTVKNYEVYQVKQNHYQKKASINCKQICYLLVQLEMFSIKINLYKS